MSKRARIIFYAAFTLFLFLINVGSGFFFFYSRQSSDAPSNGGEAVDDAPLFGQPLYWGNRSYNAGIYSVEVENGKTYITLDISENNPPQTSQNVDGVIPPVKMYLMAYGRQFFGREHMAERGRITYVFDTAGIPDIIFVYIAGQYNDFKTHISFDGRTKEPVVFFIPPENAVDVHTFLNQEKLRISAAGYSREFASMTFENTSGTALPIKSGIGIWLKNYDKNFQNMALAADCAFIAEPGKMYGLILPAVCLNKGREFPEKHNAFTVERFDDSELLIPVLRELSLSDLAHSEIQDRIWAAIESDINTSRGRAWYR